MLKDWKLFAAVIGGLALVVILGVLAWNFDPFGRLKRAKAVAATSQSAQRQAEATTQALDTHVQRTVIIRERADAAVQIVQAAPGAGDPISPDVLSAWRSGLRDNSSPDNADSPAGSTGTLPPT